MRKIIPLLIMYIIFAIQTNAQSDSSFNAKPRHHIKIYTVTGDTMGGILTRTNGTAVFIYPGNFREWKQQKTVSITVTPYTTIKKIETRKKGWVKVLNGMVIGAGIGLAPVLIGSLFGPSVGEGAAYVSIAGVPLGIVIGGVVGATSKKKFQIESDKTKFHRFRKKIKK